MDNKKPVSRLKSILYGLLAFFMLFIFAAKAESRPKIALIIDDMGLNRELGQAALQLSGAVTYSFLVNTPYAHELADSAHEKGKQVMLHAPMQAIAESEHETGELSADMPADVFSQLLTRQLLSLPNIAGVNNHKGSLLTQDYQAMARVMSVIKQQTGTALFFVDSKTAQASIAGRVAKEFGLAVRARDVFLDHDSPDQAEIRKQFKRLIEIARAKGSALGIAHPRKDSLQVLREELSQLADYGVQLVPASELMQLPRKEVVTKSVLRSIPVFEPVPVQQIPASEFELF